MWLLKKSTWSNWHQQTNPIYNFWMSPVIISDTLENNQLYTQGCHRRLFFYCFSYHFFKAEKIVVFFSEFSNLSKILSKNWYSK